MLLNNLVLRFEKEPFTLHLLYSCMYSYIRFYVIYIYLLTYSMVQSPS